MDSTIAQQPRKKRAVAPKPAAGIEAPSSSESSASRSRQILAALTAFRDGDFSVRLPSDWADVDGQIAAAFNQITSQEARIATEVARLSATVGKEGRLKHRMSLPGSVGGWAAKVESINTLLDDLVRPTAEIARTIGAVAKFLAHADAQPLQLQAIA